MAKDSFERKPYYRLQKGTVLKGKTALRSKFLHYRYPESAEIIEYELTEVRRWTVEEWLLAHPKK